MMWESIAFASLILAISQTALVCTTKVSNEDVVNITVSDAPKLIGLVDELNNPEGTDASIICSVGSGHLPSLSYEWSKDKERLFASLGKLKIDTPSDNYHSVLRIFDLKPEDSGTYICIARNRFGQDKISTKLNVKVQLKWLSQPNDTEISVGQSVAIPCRGDGNPKPKVSWSKILFHENGHEELINLDQSELRFSSVSPPDSGIYECRVTNGVDDDLVAKVKLTVRGGVRKAACGALE